jgi:hypothetical protein
MSGQLLLKMMAGVQLNRTKFFDNPTVRSIIITTTSVSRISRTDTLATNGSRDPEHLQRQDHARKTLLGRSKNHGSFFESRIKPPVPRQAAEADHAGAMFVLGATEVAMAFPRIDPSSIFGFTRPQ